MLLIANAAYNDLDKPISVVYSMKLKCLVRKGPSKKHFERILKKKEEIIDNQYQYAIIAGSVDDGH